MILLEDRKKLLLVALLGGPGSGPRPGQGWSKDRDPLHVGGNFNYSQENIDRLAKPLLPPGWKIHLVKGDSLPSNNDGITHYINKTILIRSRRQGTEAEFVKTVIHEVAHAQLPGTRHNSEWYQRYQDLLDNHYK